MSGTFRRLALLALLSATLLIVALLRLQSRPLSSRRPRSPPAAPTPARSTVGGDLACWGDDSSGQVSEAPSGQFIAVSAGARHTCAIAADGTLACWGDDAATQPDQIPTGEFQAVSAGGAHSCAIRSRRHPRLLGRRLLRPARRDPHHRVGRVRLGRGGRRPHLRAADHGDAQMLGRRLLRPGQRRPALHGPTGTGGGAGTCTGTGSSTTRSPRAAPTPARSATRTAPSSAGATTPPASSTGSRRASSSRSRPAPSTPARSGPTAPSPAGATTPPASSTGSPTASSSRSRPAAPTPAPCGRPASRLLGRQLIRADPAADRRGRAAPRRDRRRVLLRLPDHDPVSRPAVPGHRGEPAGRPPPQRRRRAAPAPRPPPATSTSR